MYQIPWEVRESCVITNEVAYHLIGKCIRSIKDSIKHEDIETDTNSTDSGREVERLAAEQLQNIREGFVKKGECGNECFELLRVRGTVQLLPNSIGNIEESIKRYLCYFLFHYIAEYYGIWVCFHKVSAKNKYGYIPDCEPSGSFLVNIEFKALVFKPKLNEQLICRICHISPSHISGITYGLLNITVPTKDLVESDFEFRRVDSSSCESNSLVNKKNNEQVLKTGSLIVIKIKKYSFSDNGDFITSITGKFDSIYECNG
ncbi:RPB7 like OB fold RNA polymerase subunit [Cryptosporidium bovis]|uniref:RPB7 like OB fold RNA polymerase subunit n=1 Tax=Cryptosporidium bovis TaxID=310047 RepID=UPI00351A5FB1|nr:RPB7 like OB fold RNA polymerase subunit [Cryptosporidium bovis]